MFDRRGKHLCSSSGTHRGTLVKDPMINHAKGQELYYKIQNKNVSDKDPTETNPQQIKPGVIQDSCENRNRIAICH
jgi:hypothetical protein